jgi:hypothetical protein
MSNHSSDEVFNKFKRSLDSYIYKESSVSKYERFLYYRGKRENKVLLIAHSDTFFTKEHLFEKEEKELVHFTHRYLGLGNTNRDDNNSTTTMNQFIQNKNGNQGIGADDRAGCAILYLLKDSGHSLLIVDGEEMGGLGSKWLMDIHPEIAKEINQHQFMIEFDLPGEMSYKTYNVGSNEICELIENHYLYDKLPNFSYTDICTLARDICGVNLAVGYGRQHSSSEYISIKEWYRTYKLTKLLLEETELPKFKRTKYGERHGFRQKHIL